MSASRRSLPSTPRCALPLLLIALCLNALAACQGEIEQRQGSREAPYPRDEGALDQGAFLDRGADRHDSSSPRDAAADQSGAPRADLAAEPDTASPRPDAERDQEAAAPRVSLLVAQGRMGRTVLSCDGGRSWFGDRDMASEGRWGYCDTPQPEAQCGRGSCSTWDRVEVEPGRHESQCAPTTPCKCGDHATGSPRRMTWYQGHFFAAFGWGQPGSLYRSEDGLAWEEISLERRPNPSGIAGGAGVLILSTDRAHLSSDDGTSWSELEREDHLVELGHPSGITYLEEVGDQGRFVSIGRRGAYTSDDAGLSWQQVEQWPTWRFASDGKPENERDSTCGDYAVNSAYGNGILLLGRSHGDLCLSRDRGRTFERVARPDGGRSGGGFVHFARGEFYVLLGTKVATSGDGTTWTLHELDGAAHYMSTAYDPIEDRFVGVKGSYEAQRFFTSADGFEWEELSENQAPRGHEIRWFTHGVAPAGFVCPETPAP